MSLFDGCIDATAWARRIAPRSSDDQQQHPHGFVVRLGVLCVVVFEDGRVVLALLDAPIDPYRNKRRLHQEVAANARKEHSDGRA